MMLAPSTEGRRLTAAIAFSVGAGLLAWRIVLEPRAARISEKRQELAALEARVAHDRHTSTSAARSDARRARAQRLARQRARWKSPSTMAAWLEAVGALAHAHGLRLQGFKPMPAADQANRAAWQATFDLEGTFPRLRQFIEAVEEDETTDLLELRLSVAARGGRRTRLHASCVLARISPREGGGP